MNKWLGIGRLTAEPDITNNSVIIAKFILAVDRQYKKDGQPEADFIRCTAFGKSAEFVKKYLHKGIRIGVEGRIATGNYEKDGVKHFSTEIIVEHLDFCESKKTYQESFSNEIDKPQMEDYGVIGGDDSELPF